MDKRAIIIGMLSMIILLYNNLFAQETTLRKVEYSSSDLRDPLKNPLEAEGIMTVPSELEPTEDVFLPEGFLVQGMVWGVEPTKAIINDEVVSKGDTILDAQVLDIKKDGVHLLYSGKEFIVKPQ